MRITLVSRSWPSAERSGVSLIAAQHLNILVDAGHYVSIIGSIIDLRNEKLPAGTMYQVQSSGTGALYSLPNVDIHSLKNALVDSRPDLVLIEAWQTALTDAAVDVTYGMGIPILMVSHGVSLHPYSRRLVDIGRALGWSYYRINLIPRRISKLTVMTTLDENASSKRFFDRDIALRLGIPVRPLINCPVHWRESTPDFHERNMQILVVGYFSEVKNQLGALQVFAGLPATLKLRFIGQRNGAYYSKCVRRVAELGLESRVIFSQDDECDISYEIANSLVVLCTSITEALPVTLIEAMASGTPFIGTSVGAIPAMGAGIVANDINMQRSAVFALVSDAVHWTTLSEKGRQAYRSRFTQEHVRNNLLDAVALATGSAKVSRT